MKNLILFTGIAILTLGACKNNKKLVEKEESQIETSTVEKSTNSETMAPFSKDLGGELVGKYWKAIEIMGVKVEMPEGMEQEPFLKFNKDGSIKAHGGCNAIFGNYELGFKNFIEISEFSQTEMECSFESFEKSLVEALTYGKQYLLIGEGQMQIIVGKRAPLAKFEVVYF
tara:strand:- start:3498 stop:4010 length:513 start_codon:yes stop_codon:yes gene_type:complete